MGLYAGPIFEIILPGQGITQVLGNCVDVFVFRPSYSAHTESNKVRADHDSWSNYDHG
jgi:hypothetical protein